VLGLRDVEEAATRLEGVAHRTPVVTSRTLDDRTGARLFVKPENLQRGGAFKFRGAYNAISSLPADQLQRGVAAYSSGNHAQAVAIAAALLGAQAVILMPEDAPVAKFEATRGYGAEIVTYDRYAQDREALGQALANERGMALIPPYEHPLVMAGQGTVGYELLADASDLDVLVVPVGGGGLIAGCATAAKALRPSIRVVGVEPDGGDDTKRSLESGERIALPVPRTIADGLQATTPGELTFQVNRRLVDEIVTVEDAELVEAMRFAFERLKLVVEPSGAAGLAALLGGHVAGVGTRRVGVVISGGNVGAARFAELVSS
jgi:threonine dehydratase